MLTVQQVAEAADISVSTVRQHHKVAARARKLGVATDRHLPAPTDIVDGANVWDEKAITAWVAARQRPARRGGIPKEEMRAVLEAAQAGQIDRVITIARRNLS